MSSELFKQAIDLSLENVRLDPADARIRDKLFRQEEERQLLMPQVLSLWFAYQNRFTNEARTSPEINHIFGPGPDTRVFEYNSQLKITSEHLIGLEGLLWDRQASHAALLGVDDPRTPIKLGDDSIFLNPFLNDNYEEASRRMEDETGILPQNLRFYLWAGASNHYLDNINVEEQKEIAVFEDPSGKMHAVSLRRLQALSKHYIKGKPIEIDGQQFRNPEVYIYLTKPWELGVIKNTLERALA